jgi:glycosyltransferase involved in cell wall biosynthesis
MDDEPLHSASITVGMPVFNGESYIEQALESLLAQTLGDFEVVISDNCSSDRTGEICRSYAGRDSRITYHRQPSNIGFHRNFQFVTAAAKGRFITWLAHDDVLEPQFLELTSNLMRRTPQVVVASGDFQVIDAAGKEVAVERLVSIRSDLPWSRRRAEFFRFPISNVFYCMYGLMRAEDCKRIFGRLPEPKIAAGNELPVLARFAVAGEIASIPTVLRRYRRHADSAFSVELSGLQTMPFLRRWWLNTGNLYQRRLDQICVLLTSSLTVEAKSRTLAAVASFYARLFIARLGRAPTKLIRLLTR